MQADDYDENKDQGSVFMYSQRGWIVSSVIPSLIPSMTMEERASED
jgi:hypothetical protein